MADAAPKCIDISHWQGSPDFAKVRAAGVLAMIHKATEGTGYRDPTCGPNTVNAQKNGIKCATYHWLKPARYASAVDQMKFYLQTIDPVPGERVIIDYEENGCVLQDLLQAVAFLLSDPRKLQITVYSGHLLKEQLANAGNVFLASNTDLWLAQYTTGAPIWPANTYPKWTLWQYSETGKLPGIDGSTVDFNKFNGTDQELLDWISPRARAPIGVPEAVPVLPGSGNPTVLPAIDITIPANVIGLVQVRMNGKVVG